MEAKRRGLVSKSFLNDLIMNYLIVQGYQAAAEQFQLEVGVYISLKIEVCFFKRNCLSFDLT